MAISDSLEDLRDPSLETIASTDRDAASRGTAGSFPGAAEGPNPAEILPDGSNLSPVPAGPDASLIVFEECLTASDKKLLGKLQGEGRWESSGPANLLVAEVAYDRTEGILTGEISASFLRSMMDNGGEDGACEIAPDVLSEALAYLQSNAEEAA